MTNKARSRPAKTTTVKPYGLVGRDHPVLRSVSLPVAQVTSETRLIAARLAETLRRHPEGMAIAAPQVGLGIRLVVVSPGRAYANPRYYPDEDSGQITDVEGCLSLPGRWFEVPRWQRATVKAVDVVTGHLTKLEVEAVHSRMWAHELEHLDGLIIADRYPEKFQG